MNLEKLRDRLPDFAKDIKLNLSSIFCTDGSPDLSEEQIKSVALASAYATKNPTVIMAIEGEVSASLSAETKQAAKAVATIMAMNNIYYRFLHLLGDDEVRKLPAKMRMNIIANPGVEKREFELMSLAVSVLNGCGMCIEAHARQLTEQGLSKLAVQSTARIAAVVNAAAQAVELM
ncbi:MAG: carboxymuconolactone decarboxylase family protein [Deltaproteobacteria bacterium]|nr:carboxymuconolactone decarboxylase family protein [Deltaproteobacteria bacterium]